MNSGFYQPRRLSPTGLTIVVLLHGAAIAALMMAKMDMPSRLKIPPILVYPVPVPPDPTPHPRQPTKPQPHQIDHTVPRVPHPDPLPPAPPPPPFPDPGPTVGSGSGDVGPILPPPPPPPPRIIEPARAKANLGSYVSDADYPPSSVRNEEQGTTRFLLQVGSDGRVTGCTITRSSGSAALDSTACRLLRSRARFTPARDGNGNPTTDSVANAIRWVLPGG